VGFRDRSDGAVPARLYRTIVEMRTFEETVGDLWLGGAISGELHLGIGEEGVVAGVVDHVEAGDGLALDHRSTPPLIARGTDPGAIALELLGHADGLCHGAGGHMHLFDPDRLVASSGIVGASAPTACGFALAGQRSNDRAIAVSFMGEGAVNQGMVSEAWNLASVWRLPVVFVVKDSGWAITTRSARLTGGSLAARARGFGIPAVTVDGHRPLAVWSAAARAVSRARSGHGPTVIIGRVSRPRGHFEGDPLVRMARDPREILQETRVLLGDALGRGGRTGLSQRARGVVEVTRTLATMIREQQTPTRDPLASVERRLDPQAAQSIRAEARRRIEDAVGEAVGRAGVAG
jgi:TPP-dependent pyruvate/acetoin dehydrogenase alpha subunit